MGLIVQLVMQLDDTALNTVHTYLTSSFLSYVKSRGRHGNRYIKFLSFLVVCHLIS